MTALCSEFKQLPPLSFESRVTHASVAQQCVESWLKLPGGPRARRALPSLPALDSPARSCSRLSVPGALGILRVPAGFFGHVEVVTKIELPYHLSFKEGSEASKLGFKSSKTVCIYLKQAVRTNVVWLDLRTSDP